MARLKKVPGRFSMATAELGWWVTLQEAGALNPLTVRRSAVLRRCKDSPLTALTERRAGVLKCARK